MTKHKDEQRRLRHPGESPREVQDPYWMRAHRDWRFLAVVFLMLAAIATYVMTGNLAWRPRGGQPLPLLDQGPHEMTIPGSR